MTRLHVRAFAIAAILFLAACGGLKDALTAHVDIAARAGGQELSSTRLAQLMTSGAQIPARPQAAELGGMGVQEQVAAAGDIEPGQRLLGRRGQRPRGDVLGGDVLVDGIKVAEAVALSMLQETGAK